LQGAHRGVDARRHAWFDGSGHLVAAELDAGQVAVVAHPHDAEPEPA